MRLSYIQTILYFCFRQNNKEKAMAKFTYILIVTCAFALGGCQSVEELSIDYLVPADVSFPSSLKRVGIVDNMSSAPDNAIIADSTKNPFNKNELARQTKYFNGNPTTTTESLAEAVEKEKYFDEVVICDSALRSNDILPRESILSKTEVEYLTKKLDVDFIVSLENIQLSAVRKIHYLPEWGVYQGSVDVKVYPTVRIYLPNRNGPMVTIHPQDSIFWEKESRNKEQLPSLLISEKEMIEQASDFAGNVPVKHFIPYWKTAQRYYLTGNSSLMRDASVYAREKKWDKAIALWEEAYKQKKGKQKMFAAYNLALGYEMKDSIDMAEEWALKAQQEAIKIDKIGETYPKELIVPQIVPNYYATTSYLKELQERKDGLMKLNAQMDRFKNDF